MSQIRVIPNGLWTYVGFSFNRPILGEEFRGITGGFTEAGREHSLELNRFRESQRQTMEEEVMEALRNLGNTSLFIPAEDNRPQIEFIDPIATEQELTTTGNGEVITIDLAEIPQDLSREDFVSRWENAVSINRTAQLNTIGITPEREGRIEYPLTPTEAFINTEELTEQQLLSELDRISEEN